jgi:hypothetical protein
MCNREGSAASSSIVVILFLTIAVRLRVGNSTVINGLVIFIARLATTIIAGFVLVVSNLWIAFVLFPQWSSAMTVVSAVFTTVWFVI